MVVSILLAFGIDAWWERREDDNEVRELLQSVAGDFRDSRAELADRRRFNDDRMQSVVRLMELSFIEQESIAPDEVDRLASDLMWFQNSMPLVTSSLESLVSSSHLSNVDDPALRANLSAWSANLNWLHAQLRQQAAFVEDTWTPFAHRKAYLPQMAMVMEYPGGGVPDDYSRFPVAPTDSFDHRQLLDDKEFHNILYTAWSVIYDDSWAIDQTDALLDESIKLIEDELER